MTTETPTTSVTLTDSSASTVKTDVLVLFSYRQDDTATLAPAHGLADEAVEHIEETLAAIGADAKPDENVKVTGVPSVAAKLVLVTGTGLTEPPAPGDAEAIRVAAGSAVRTLAGTAKVAVAVPGSEPETVGAVAQGALFGAYAYNGYRSSGGTAPVEKLTLVSSAARTAAARAQVKRAEVLADTQAFARDLVNTPPNDLYPASFAERVKKRLSGTGVKVQIQDEKALAKAEAGGLIGVGRGSSRPPRLVTLTWSPSRADKHVAIVGKGITFDSGGLCIKPGASMVTMKCDMAGAAAAAAAVEAAARLELPVQVTAYLCLAENMTGSDAQRPGDVVTMPNGKTVEIINTDAEGRLVMADGLSFASTTSPDAIVDIATLTGAAVMALGGRTTAVLSNDDEAAETMLTAAERAGEQQWRIPLKEHLRADMNSDVADVKHTGGREGGMITAALFLREFVGDDGEGAQIPWVHLDIAGPAFNDGGAHGYTPKGGTGHGVRSLVSFVESYT